MPLLNTRGLEVSFGDAIWRFFLRKGRRGSSGKERGRRVGRNPGVSVSRSDGHINSTLSLQCKVIMAFERSLLNIYSQGILAFVQSSHITAHNLYD